MTFNSKMVGACLASLGAGFAAYLVCKMAHEGRKCEEKKFIKEAVRAWEGEGGNILEPRMPATGH